MTPRHFTLLAVAATLCMLAAIAGLFTQNGAADSEPTPPTQRYDRAAAAAFVASKCWQCHTVSTLQIELARDFGEQAAGARATGPDLAGIGALYSDGWHTAHLFNPQSVIAHSRMPAQRDLFVLEGQATVPNIRGEARPALKYNGQMVIAFLQSLTLAAPGRATWPRGMRELPESGSVPAGKRLFGEFCSGCHGTSADGKGEAAVFFSKPPANLAASRLMWRTVRAPIASYDDIYTTITNGLPGSGMPSFSHLSALQRSSLVAYIAALNREVFDAYEPQFDDSVLGQPPPVTPDLIAQGKALFASDKYKCGSCHGANGRGDGDQRAELVRKFGVSPRNLVADRFRRGGLEGVYASIALGLGEAMPGQLKDDGSNKGELWALAAFAESLNEFER